MRWNCSWTEPLLLMLLAATLTSTATLAAVSRSSLELYGDIHTPGEFDSLSQTRPNLCQRELPAIFFQTHKEAPVRGNGSSIYYQRIEQCCEGYRTDPYNGHCVPDCVHSSPDNCRNGFCRATGRCECFAEQCVAPDKCECSPGYRRIPEMGCQPICAPDCGYGKCVAPNECECIPGFMKRRQRNVCEAECYLNCENGFCESRFKCHCRAGYRYDDNTTSCLPVCQDDCGHGNGVCIAPGICRCFQGYELRGNSCEPLCEGSCGFYGKCLTPNVCGCGPDEQHCINGSCDANGHCQCAAGWTHFLGKCLEPQQIEQQLSSRQRRKEHDDELNYEFNALIGRLFNWS